MSAHPTLPSSSIFSPFNSIHKSKSNSSQKTQKLKKNYFFPFLFFSFLLLYIYFFPFLLYLFLVCVNKCIFPMNIVTGPVQRFARQIAGHGYIVAAPSSYHEFTGPEPLAYDVPGTDAGNNWKVEKVSTKTPYLLCSSVFFPPHPPPLPIFFLFLSISSLILFSKLSNPSFPFLSLSLSSRNKLHMTATMRY